MRDTFVVDVVMSRRYYRLFYLMPKTIRYHTRTHSTACRRHRLSRSDDATTLSDDVPTPTVTDATITDNADNRARVYDAKMNNARARERSDMIRAARAAFC